MEGHPIQEPVHVTVQMATVGLPVELTKLHVSYLKLHNICCKLPVIRDQIYICSRSVSSCSQTLKCRCMYIVIISHVSTNGMTICDHTAAGFPNNYVNLITTVYNTYI